MAAGQAARRGRDLVARSRHRLGRRRPGDPGRRAQGRQRACCSASAAPTTGWTSRAAPCWCRPTASRCWNAAPPLRGDRGARARRRSAAAGRPRRAGPAHRSAWPAPQPFDRRRALSPRCASAAPYRRPAAQGFRRRARLRRDRRLRAGGLRPLAPAEAAATTGAGCCASTAGRAAVPHECRHHRRGAADEGAAAAAGRCWARSRNTSSRRWCRATPSCSPAGCCASRASRRPVVAVLAGGQRRSQGAGLCRRPPAAHDLPRRPGARHPAATRELAPSCRPQVREWLRLQRSRSRLPDRDELLVETFPRGGAAVPGRLLLRGPQRAPDAGHAADPAHGARGPEAAGLRRHRLRARPSGACEPADRQLDQLFDEDMLGDDLEAWMDEIDHAAAHLPQRRGDRRPDRAAPSRAGEDRAAR